MAVHFLSNSADSSDCSPLEPFGKLVADKRLGLGIEVEVLARLVDMRVKDLQCLEKGRLELGDFKTGSAFKLIRALDIPSDLFIEHIPNQLPDS